MSEELMVKCAMSDVNLDDFLELEAYLFHMTSIWPSIVGKASYNKGNMYERIPSNVKLDINPKYQAFTAVNRAFTVVVLLNYAQKWEHISKLVEGNPGNKDKKIPPKPTKAQLESGVARYQEANKYHEARWTSCKKGQVKYCSWAEEGMAKFKEIHDKVKAHMEKNGDEMRKVEMEMVKQLNEFKNKKGKKTGTQAEGSAVTPVMQAKPVLKDQFYVSGMSDDSDEEEDEEATDTEDEHDGRPDGETQAVWAPSWCIGLAKFEVFFYV